MFWFSSSKLMRGSDFVERVPGQLSPRCFAFGVTPGFGLCSLRRVIESPVDLIARPYLGHLMTMGAP